MTWAQIDDRLHGHPKILQAWQRDPAALGLELLALSWCADHLTDGAVSDEFVRQWFPHRNRQKAVIQTLNTSHLWVPDTQNGGWQIHDYLDYNESRAVILERRRAREEKKKRNRETLTRRRKRVDEGF